MSKALTASWQDVWLLDGVRTPFVDYNGGLAAISPIDLPEASASVLRQCSSRRFCSNRSSEVPSFARRAFA